MAKTGKFLISDMKKLQRQMNIIQQGSAEAFVEGCAKGLAQRLLRKVIKRTPVGDYSGNPYLCEGGLSHKGNKVVGKEGGTLRRNWKTTPIAFTHKEGNIKIVVYNPKKYASYAEYGHRKANGKGWVQGHFMMTKSKQEIESIAPKVLESKEKKFLEESFK